MVIGEGWIYCRLLNQKSLLVTKASVYENERPLLSCHGQGLDALEKYESGRPAERLVNVLFGVEPPSAAREDAATTTRLESRYCSQLNESQRAAVAFALATRDIAVIHGPPGASGRPLSRPHSGPIELAHLIM